jgi:hypothetical protein
MRGGAIVGRRAGAGELAAQFDSERAALQGEIAKLQRQNLLLREVANSFGIDVSYV